MFDSSTTPDWFKIRIFRFRQTIFVVFSNSFTRMRIISFYFPNSQSAYRMEIVTMRPVFAGIAESTKIPFIRKTRLDSLRICYHIKYARFGSSCIRITVSPREVYSKRLHISQAISIKKYIMSYTRQRILVT